MCMLGFFLLWADIKPAYIGRQQYINTNPLMGAHADSCQAATEVMQKLTDTAREPLEAPEDLFGRSDLFEGYLIHRAKVHEDHMIMELSKTTDEPTHARKAQYRLVLKHTWEKATHYTHQAIEVVRQSISTILDALEEAKKWMRSHTYGRSSHHRERIQKKTKETLLAELKAQNPEQIEFIEHTLSPQLEQTWHIYRSQGIDHWTPAQIQSWKTNLISQPNRQHKISEVLAVLMRVTKLAYNYVPHDTQLLSVLSFLHQKGKGQFLQVKTGEGKSLSVAMLAASKVLLEDSPVDVLSSSEVLAERDATDEQAGQKKFYDLLGITVGFKDHSNVEAVAFYQNHQVIYGDMTQLLGDVLRQSYRGEPTRGNRPFSTLIIDEVDSLLVDRVDNICQLTTPLACSETLLPFLQLLWLQLNQLEITSNQSHTINTILEEFCESLLDGTNSQFQLPMPPFLKVFVRLQIPQWVRTARRAQQMQHGVQYLYYKDEDPDKPGTIKIVDHAHTGVIQENMLWGDGLHQFLLLKHQGYIYPETLTSCFASMDTHLSRYQKNIFGLTGTLGDETTRQFIQSAYGVSLLDIPTYAPKRFTEYPGIVCADLVEWKNTVIHHIEEATRKGHIVWVVNESIQMCHYLFQFLSPLYAQGQRYLYDRNESTPGMTTEFKPLNPGDVVLTTNLGGRGTDILVDHVIVTSLSNARVKDQAMGRAARQGRIGSGQVIALDKQAQTFDQLQTLRTHEENQRIEHLHHEVLPHVRLIDRLFNKVDTTMGSLLQNIPLAQHPESGKIRQIDQLWALQYHRLRYYKTHLYQQWQKDLSRQLDEWGLTLGQGGDRVGQTALQSLYTLAQGATEEKIAPTADALKSLVVSHLLSQQSTWTKAELDAFSAEYGDSRHVPDALLEALCHVTQCTYVCIDHTGAMRVARYPDDDAPVICLGRIVGQSITPDLSVLQPLYPSIQCTPPSPIATSQLVPTLYLASLREDQISDQLRNHIQTIPALRLSYEEEANPHPHLHHVLDLMKCKSQQRQAKRLAQEEQYQSQWVEHFLQDIKTLYASGDDILIIPAELVKRARTQGPYLGEPLFERAVNIPDAYKALVYYNWANYKIRHQVSGYKAKALDKLEKCQDTLNQQLQLWQYITVFAGDHADHNPIGCQVRGRLGVYKRFLSNIQSNLGIIQSAGPEDKIVINSDEDVINLVDVIVHFKAQDAVQLKNQGLDLLSFYGTVPPERSFFDIAVVNVLGVFQTLIGGIMTSAGIPFGPTVLASGLQDIWKGVKSLFTGVFSWENYFIDKSFELLTAAVSHVYGVIKDNVLKVKGVLTSSVTAQRTVMETIVSAAKTTLINNITSELRTRAVTFAVTGVRDDMQQAVHDKVEQLLAEPVIRIHIEHASQVAYLLDMYLSLFQNMIERIKTRAEAQQHDVYQTLSHLTRTCMEQHHPGSGLARVVSSIAMGVKVGRQAQDVMRCVDTYIQMLREEVMIMANNIPSIELFLAQLYTKFYHTAPPNIIGEYVSYLRNCGIFVGPRPYQIQNTLDNTGVKRYANPDQALAAVKQMFHQTINQNRLTALVFGKDNDLKLFKCIANFLYNINQNAEAVFYKSLVKAAFIQNGTQLLFNKTITLADTFAKESISLTQQALQNFRTTVNQVQQEHLQREQQKQETQSTESAQQTPQSTQQQRAPRSKAAAPKPKRTHGEADTAYTQQMQTHLHIGTPDHAATLRNYYSGVIPTVNQHRKARAQTPPPDPNSWLRKTGREIVRLTPDLIKGGVNLMIQTVRSDIAWVAQQFPKTASVVGTTLQSVNYVTSEVPETATRRFLRDDLGLPQGWAQDGGAFVGFFSGNLALAQVGKVATIGKSAFVSKGVAATNTVVNKAASASKAALYKLDAQAVATFDRYVANLAQKVPAQGRPSVRDFQPKVYNPNAPQTSFTKRHDAGKGVGTQKSSSSSASANKATENVSFPKGSHPEPQISTGQSKSLKTQKAIEYDLSKADRVGSAMKDDIMHRSATFGTKLNSELHNFSCVGKDGKNYTLYQRKGIMNEKPGIFEYVQNEDGKITHQRFIKNGLITGTPNQKVK